MFKVVIICNKSRETWTKLKLKTQNSKVNVMARRKINKNWYRINTKTDRFCLASEVVDIIRTEHNEWSVCDDEVEIGSKASDKRRYVFIKLASAKKFADALSIAMINETPYPHFTSEFGE